MREETNPPDRERQPEILRGEIRETLPGKGLDDPAPVFQIASKSDRH